MTTTSFGFQTVREDEKPALVRGVFDAVADRYDFMNDLMSFGAHRRWKDLFVQWLAPRPGWRCVDVGGGTGDIAFRILDAIARLRPHAHGGDGARPRAHVDVVDINEKMLTVGRDRAINQGRLHGLGWTVGDAESLPFADAVFDCYTTAFCLRNVTRLDAALVEARRVLKPGGRFLCLEFSQMELPGFDKAYDLYSFHILPRMGKLVVNDAEAYRYLAESIRRFPRATDLLRRIDAAGLKRGQTRALWGGAVAMSSAYRV